MMYVPSPGDTRRHRAFQRSRAYLYLDSIEAACCLLPAGGVETTTRHLPRATVPPRGLDRSAASTSIPPAECMPFDPFPPDPPTWSLTSSISSGLPTAGALASYYKAKGGLEASSAPVNSNHDCH
jgi:hypothetical protein